MVDENAVCCDVDGRFKSFISIYIYIYGDKEEKRNLLCAIIFFLTVMLVNLIVLSLIWPGAWGGDELWLLPQIRYFDIATVQHWCIALLYIYSLMLIPSPVGIIFFLILFNVTVQTIIFSRIYDKVHGSRWAFLYIIPCCVPEILLFNEYPLRCSIYGSIEILCILLIERMHERYKKWDLLKICILVILLATLRSETIYYLLFGIVIVIYFYKKKIISKKQLLIGMMLISFGSWSVNHIQNVLTYPRVFDRNVLTSVLDPLVEMTRNEAGKYANWEESDLLTEIDKTISVNVILQNTSTGIYLMWSDSENLFKNGKPEIQGEFWKSYIKLVIKNWNVFLHNRWLTFKQSQEINIRSKAEASIYLWSEEMKELPPTVLNKDFFAFEVTNYERYVTVLKMMTSYEDKEVVVHWLRLLCNTIIVPGGFLVYCLFISVYNKKWIKSMLLTSVLMKIPLIYMTMPATDYMYYYPVYYVGIMAMFAHFILKAKNR